MNFQQAIAAFEEVSVKFSVINPLDSTDDGFFMSNLNNPVVSLPVYVTNFGALTYQYEA